MEKTKLRRAVEPINSDDESPPGTVRTQTDPESAGTKKSTPTVTFKEKGTKKRKSVSESGKKKSTNSQASAENLIELDENVVNGQSHPKLRDIQWQSTEVDDELVNRQTSDTRSLIEMKAMQKQLELVELSNLSLHQVWQASLIFSSQYFTIAPITC